MFGTVAVDSGMTPVTHESERLAAPTIATDAVDAFLAPFLDGGGKTTGIASGCLMAVSSPAGLRYSASFPFLYLTPHALQRVFVPSGPDRQSGVSVFRQCTQLNAARIPCSIGFPIAGRQRKARAIANARRRAQAKCGAGLRREQMELSVDDWWHLKPELFGIVERFRLSRPHRLTSVHCKYI
jgi:hypothetical protein